MAATFGDDSSVKLIMSSAAEGKTVPESLRLKALGYWRDTRHGEEYRVPVLCPVGEVADLDWNHLTVEQVLLPHPQILVGPPGSAGDPQQVAEYLRQGRRFSSSEGFSYCRFGCGNDCNGCMDLTDGEWVWPEGLAHYVEQHAVRLPDAFVRPLETRDWRMPPAAEVSRRVKEFFELCRQRAAKGKRDTCARNVFDWSVWIAWADAHDSGGRAEPVAAP